MIGQPSLGSIHNLRALFPNRLLRHDHELSQSCHFPPTGEKDMAPDIRTIDEIRRRVITELVDLEIVSARRLPRHQRIFRTLRCRGAQIIGRK